MTYKIYSSEDSGTSLKAYINCNELLFIAVFPSDSPESVEYSQFITLCKEDVTELIEDLKTALKEMP